MPRLLNIEFLSPAAMTVAPAATRPRATSYAAVDDAAHTRSSRLGWASGSALELVSEALRALD